MAMGVTGDYSCGGGGGGSGGVIYLSAPTVTVDSGAVVSATNGRGGSGSGNNNFNGGNGGDGGPGRIRISATPATCTLGGTFTPGLVFGCRLSPMAGTPGYVYVGAWPN
jgi:hypothetical protein